MTDLKTIRERAERTKASSPYTLLRDGHSLAQIHACDVLTLLRMIEEPDDAAVARARAAYYDPANARGGRLRAALRAAFTEE